MNRIHSNPLFVSLAVVTTFGLSTANATDDRMWREHVPGQSNTVIKLAQQPVDPSYKLGNDSLPWREQVPVASKSRVFIAEPALRRYAKSSDTRLWREQVAPQRAKNSSKTAHKVVAQRKDSEPKI